MAINLRALLQERLHASVSSDHDDLPQARSTSTSKTPRADDSYMQNGEASGSVEQPWWNQRAELSGTKKPVKKGKASKRLYAPTPHLKDAQEYVHVAMTMDTDPSHGSQTNGRTIKAYQCVSFWPFVGPKSVETMEQWENCVAVCGSDRLIVAKITEDEPWTILFELNFADDELYTLAWSLDPIELKPIIAVSGLSGLIYIVDVAERSIARILSGHGDSVLGLDFSPSHPHILASASEDKTARIWNILGGDLVTPAAGVHPSFNFPMAMADEGDVAIAVLAGEGRGGHQAKVVGVAFHPTYQVVATCGEDYFVKIWALPAFPPPLVSQPTNIGYRPHVVHFPIFSTNRIHTMCVDCIAWLSKDVLISRGADDIKCWQWLEHDRFFQPGQTTVPLHHFVIRDDYDRSHSFRLIAKYDQANYLGSHPIWYLRFGLHYGFEPDGEGPWLVNGTLLAIGDRYSRSPAILLFNPLMAQDGPPPPFITTPRLPSTAEEAESDDETKKTSTLPLHPAPPSTAPPQLLPWQLLPRGYAVAARSSPSMRNEIGMVRHCAISPRGAQWIVGVGEGQCIFVYQLRPT